jgi:predicted Zn-dependent protease
MRAATFETMKNIRDTGLVPEAMYNQISEKGTVYDYVHNKNFPYEKVLELAVTACDGDLQALSELKKVMKSKHPVMRYWGAVGCTIRGNKAASARGLLQSLLRDPEPAVQLAAAEALVAVGEKQAGLKGLVDVLSTTRDEMVVLEALHIAAAYKLTGSIPRPIYEQACQVGKYPKGMLSDYPGNS